MALYLGTHTLFPGYVTKQDRHVGIFSVFLLTSLNDYQLARAILVQCPVSDPGSYLGAHPSSAWHFARLGQGGHAMP